MIPNILNEEEIEVVFDEIVNTEDFEKSNTEIETYESIEAIKFPQEHEDGGNIILDDLKEKEMNNPRVQAMFKRTRHNNLSRFIIGQGYYELPKRTIGANGNIYHILKANNFRDVLNIYPDKSSMDMTLNKFKFLTSTCWNEKNQPLIIDMSKDKYTGRYILGLNNIFFPDSSPF